MAIEDGIQQQQKAGPSLSSSLYCAKQSMRWRPPVLGHSMQKSWLSLLLMKPSLYAPSAGDLRDGSLHRDSHDASVSLVANDAIAHACCPIARPQSHLASIA